MDDFFLGECPVLPPDVIQELQERLYGVASPWIPSFCDLYEGA